MTPVFAQVSSGVASNKDGADSSSAQPVFRNRPFSQMFNESNSGFLAPGDDPENRLGWPFLMHMASDQKRFWTSPRELKDANGRPFFPFAAFTGLLIASDGWISRQVPDSPRQLQRSNHISNYAVFSLAGAAGSAFLWGQATHNSHLSETGLLAGEAALNSTAVTYAFKSITRRPRPFQGDGSGTFFQGGGSFPSEHAAVAWSLASVVAHEYPGPLTKFLAYGLASTVTLTRITSKQHFSSDVVIGSALGWYLGRQIYRAHHDPELGGAPWRNLVDHEVEEGPRNPANMGSPYVPLDNWVYPQIQRLAALGYIQSAYLGIRPWTRMQCAQFLGEAGERMGDESADGGEGQQIYEALVAEFRDETARLDGAANIGARLDSAYFGTMRISGTPLRDGYHFGQTIANDYGRPYWEGLNLIAGVSAHAVAGPFAFDVRGEFQHAPAIPSDPLSVLQATAAADSTLPVSNARAGVDRFNLLQGTVSFNLHNVQFSFGMQTGWLGPVESGSLLLSNNAESMLMLKIDTVAPFRIPLLSKLLGPAQTEFFLGQLTGHRFEFDGTKLVGPDGVNPQPYLHGTKISFKPTNNLEVGFGTTAQFAGPGLPFTWPNFLRTFYAHTSGTNNPGKRLSQFDLSYRVPGLRNWLTFYLDSLVVDEFSPLGSSRPVLNFGVYMPRVPKLPKLQIRAEGIKEPLTSEFAPGYVYYGLRRYRSGYTNDGNLMGSWIGRAGRGGQAWVTYSFSPRNKVQFGYRHQEVSKDFIGGGRAVDYSARGIFMLSSTVAFSGFVQYERWKFPVLAPNPQSNVTASMQLTLYPRWQVRK